MPAVSRQTQPIPAGASFGRPRSGSPAFVRVAIAGLMACLTGPLFAGSVFIDLVEDGGGAGIISASLSGSLDFTSGVSSTAGFSNYIAPANGTIGFGPGTGATLSWATDGGAPTMVVSSATPSAASGAIFAPFGTGGYAGDVLTDFSGDMLFLFLNGIQVDSTYVSGSALSASATISGDFASMGISSGTATTQFTLDGQANTLTVRTTAVPEPTTLATAGMGVALLWFAARRRRR